MKIENFDKYNKSEIKDIADKIHKYVLLAFKEKLKLDEINNFNSVKYAIYIKVYTNLNSNHFDKFVEFFELLNKLGIKWSYTDRNISLFYQDIDLDELNLFIDQKNFNI